MRFMALFSRKYPATRYVLSATTPTGYDFLSTRYAAHDAVKAVLVLPFDTMGLMRTVVQRLRVQRLFLMELEIWPCMLWACTRSGIPVGVVNARMEKGSFSAYRLFGGFFRPLFSMLDTVLAQSDRYARRFRRIGAPCVHTAGNIKTLRSIQPVSRDARANIRERMHCGLDDIVITAGCIHPGEATVLYDAWKALQAEGRRVKCIVVPRHIPVAERIARELGPDVVYVEDAAVDRPWELCVVAKMGVCEALYAAADIAVVGGTFIAVGGHNVWEAASYGIPVLFGPHYETQQESCTRLIDSRVGFCVHTAVQLHTTIAWLCADGREAFVRARAAFADTLTDKSREYERLIP